MPWRWAMQAAVHHGGPARGVANGLILWRKKAVKALPSGGSREGAYQGMGLGAEARRREKRHRNQGQGRAQVGRPSAGVAFFQGSGPGQGLGLGLIDQFRAEAGNLGQEGGHLVQGVLFQAFHQTDELTQGALVL